MDKKLIDDEQKVTYTLCEDPAHKRYDYCRLCNLRWQRSNLIDEISRLEDRLAQANEGNAHWFKKSCDKDRMMEWFVDRFRNLMENVPADIRDFVDAYDTRRRGPSRDAVYPSGHYHGD